MPDKNVPVGKNRLLEALPEEVYHRLQPQLEAVDLPSGRKLVFAEEPIEYVYFPDDAMASVVAMTPEGQTVEVGVIGAEGIVGFNVLLGVDAIPNEIFIQLPGSGWRIKTDAMTAESSAVKPCGR